MKLSGFIKLPVDKAKSFNSFIEGDSNSLAKSMALAAVERPGEVYNPLYIYGSRGIGKTHLVTAMANAVNDNNGEAFICRISSDIDKCLKFDHWPDLLIIDDIKPFGFDAENSLVDFVDGGGLLVISGNLPAEKFMDPPLSDLVINKGKSADIGRPEEELRIAILKARADEENINLPDDAAKFIANHIKDNISSLIGGLKRVKAHSSLAGQAISSFSAIEALKEYIWYEP